MLCEIRNGISALSRKLLKDSVSNKTYRTQGKELIIPHNEVLAYITDENYFTRTSYHIYINFIKRGL